MTKSEQDKQRAIGRFATPSKEFLRLNPTERLQGERFVTAPENDGFQPPEKRSGEKPAGVRQRKAMNKTEESFLAVLRDAFPNSRIDREGITLRWDDGMTYTPDFVVHGPQLFLFETKGPFIRRTGVEKFRAARAHWPMLEFEMWQRDSAFRWKKLL